MANIGGEKEKSCVLLNSFGDLERKQILMQKDYSDSYKWIYDKAKAIFKKKESETSPIAKLLKTKQFTNESLLDFCRRIRADAYDHIGHIEAPRREELMIIAFVGGMVDRCAAKARVPLR